MATDYWTPRPGELWTPRFGPELEPGWKATGEPGGAGQLPLVGDLTLIILGVERSLGEPADVVFLCNGKIWRCRYYNFVTWAYNSENEEYAQACPTTRHLTHSPVQFAEPRL